MMLNAISCIENSGCQNSWILRPNIITKCTEGMLDEIEIDEKRFLTPRFCHHTKHKCQTIISSISTFVQEKLDCLLRVAY